MVQRLLSQLRVLQDTGLAASEPDQPLACVCLTMTSRAVTPGKGVAHLSWEPRATGTLVQLGAQHGKWRDEFWFRRSFHGNRGKGKAELNFREGEGAWRSFLHQPLSKTISSPCSWKGPRFFLGNHCFDSICVV